MAREDEDNELIVWLTLEELSGPTYMNSKTNAEIAIQTMQSRNHINTALATAGVMQYKHYAITEARHKNILLARAPPDQHVPGRPTRINHLQLIHVGITALIL